MAKQGAELEEIERVYRSRLPELRRVAAAVCGSRDAAADLVQDAFVRAVRRRASFRGEGSFEAWLWRIVVNTARNYLRSEREHAELPADLGRRENGSVPEGASRVAAAVAALPERQRLALFLRYYADLDYHTLAATLDISPGTVGATLHAAREALLRLLAETEATR
jgi:RNA polymerase sigma-70 factor (ECF subfamily)